MFFEEQGPKLAVMVLPEDFFGMNPEIELLNGKQYVLYVLDYTSDDDVDNSEQMSDKKNRRQTVGETITSQWACNPDFDIKM